MAKASGALPRKASGAWVYVDKLTDEQRREIGLSNSESIIDVVADHDAVLDALEYAKAGAVVSFDTETGGLDPYSDPIVLVQIGDVERQYLIWWRTLKKKSKAAILALWGDPETRKAGFNLKFDAKMILGDSGLQHRGGGLLDCQLIEQVLHCGLTGKIGQTMKLTGMGPTALRWLGWVLPKDEEIRTGWEKMTPGVWYRPLADVLAAGGTREQFEEEKAKGLAKRYYAADDCVVPLRVLDCQVPWLRQLGLVDAAKLEMDFLPELAEMEMRGLPLDSDRWAALAREAEEKRRSAEAELDVLFDVTVLTRTDLSESVEVTRDKNYNSTDQLRDLIREWMFETHKVDVISSNKHLKESLVRAGMPQIRADKLFKQDLVPDPDKPGKNKQVGYPNKNDFLTGSEFVPNLYDAYAHKLGKLAVILLSTDSDVLKLYRILNETPTRDIDSGMPTKIGLPADLVDPILRLRESTTKLERYAWSWIGTGGDDTGLLHPVTGRVHTDTTQAAADTARLTTRPNIQNWPADQRYRDCVRARRGFKIVGADFSQIEPRIIGQLSLCRMYMRVFWSERPGSAGFAHWCGDDVVEALDLYGAVGAEIGVLPPEAERKSIAKLPENKTGRKESKIAVLGLGYGTGKDKFHVQYVLDTGKYWPKSKSDGLWEGFWTAAHEVKATLDHLSDLADPSSSSRRLWHPFVEGYVTYSESLAGRKRFFDAGSPSWWTQGRNHPVQGCVRAGTRIFVEDKGYVPIESVSGQRVRVFDGHTFVEGSVVDAGLKQRVRVTLMGGQSIECSPIHKFLVTSTKGNVSWVEAKDLSGMAKNRRVVVTEEVPNWDTPLGLPTVRSSSPDNGICNRTQLATLTPHELGVFLGRVASDGQVSNGTVALFVAEHEFNILEELLPILEKLGPVKCRDATRRGGDYKELRQYAIHCREMADQLLAMGIKNRVPSEVWANSVVLRGYLRGLYDGDGTVSRDGICLTWGNPDTKSEWAHEVQEALLLLGIQSRLRTYGRTSESESGRVVVQVMKRDCARFVELIGFLNHKKQAKAEALRGHARKARSTAYPLACSVKSVEVFEEQVQMYDVVDSDTNMFMANGMVTHNTGAEILKQTCVAYGQWLRANNIDGGLLLTAHDELVAEIREDQAEMAAKAMEMVMSKVGQAYCPNVPISAASYVEDFWLKD